VGAKIPKEPKPGLKGPIVDGWMYDENGNVVPDPSFESADRAPVVMPFKQE